MSSTLSPAQQRARARALAKLEVVLRSGHSTERCRIADIARRGLFLLTNLRHQPSQLVHLTISLLGGVQLSIHGMVEEVLVPNEAAEETSECGVGIRFYGLGLDTRQQWEAFVDSIDALESAEGSTEPLANENEGPPEWMREASVLLRARTQKSSPQPAPQRHDPPRLMAPREEQGHVVYRLLLPSIEALLGFSETALKAGGVFIRTEDVRPTGTAAVVCVVHPETSAEFHLPGTVAPARGPGVAVSFTGLTEQTLDAYARFAVPDDVDESAPTRERPGISAESLKQPDVGPDKPSSEDSYLEMSISELSRECDPSELFASLEDTEEAKLDLRENTESLRVKDLDSLGVLITPPPISLDGNPLKKS